MISMNDNIILYGIGFQCQRLLDAFPGLLRHIKCFVDTYSYKKEFMGKPVKKPSIFKEISNACIVVTPTKSFYEIYGMLRKEYGLADEQILYTREWLSDMLDSDSELLLLPPNVRIDACTICQLDCVDCYMRKSNYGGVGKGYLKFEHFKQFLHDNSFVRSVELSHNGEVFLNPELLDIIKYASEKGVEITIANGVNFNTVSDAVLEALVKYSVRRILFSIDGVSQDVYARYRTNGNVERVFNNIRVLNEYKRKYSSEFPELCWQYILMEHNQHEIGKAKKIAKELGMDIYYKLDWGNEFKPKDPEYVTQITGYTVFNRKDWFKKYHRPYTIGQCEQMIFQPQINWDGRLSGCCGVYQKDWNINVFETGFVKALNQGLYREALQAFLKGEQHKYLNEVCSFCSAGAHIVGKGKVLQI